MRDLADEIDTLIEKLEADNDPDESLRFYLAGIRQSLESMAINSGARIRPGPDTVLVQDGVRFSLKKWNRKRV
jgi:hypothetical protein